MSRSFQLWDQTVDLGPHRFFSNDPRVNRLWLEVAQRDYRMVDRLTRIYYGGRFFNYPLDAANALRNLGLFESTRCLMSYFKEKVSSARQTDTFESWVVGRFGRRLFEIFFKTYSEKLWGIRCDELDSDFAAQRIKKLSLGQAVRSALGLNGGSHRTLVDRFAYPTQGTGMIYDRMADLIEVVGSIHLESPVRRVLHRDKRVTGLELMSGRQQSYDQVISTMPFTLLVKGLNEAPEEVQKAVNSLTFRNTVLVYLNIDGIDLFPDQWVYVHAADLKTGRVTNFRNWIPELYGDAPTSILALEYWCYDQNAIWKESDATLIERASSEIRATGLIGKQIILDGHVVRVPRSYPVYARNYKDHLSVATEYLQSFSGLTPIGRYGAFKYNNQDHSILMGLLAAESLIDRRLIDLWSINTDYETYQESSTITDTGLETALS